MFLPSGIILPADGPLPLRKVMPGLYIVERSYERDLGYFSESPLYKKDFTDDEAETVVPKKEDE